MTFDSCIPHPPDAFAEVIIIAMIVTYFLLFLSMVIRVISWQLSYISESEFGDILNRIIRPGTTLCISKTHSVINGKKILVEYKKVNLPLTRLDSGEIVCTNIFLIEEMRELERQLRKLAIMQKDA